MKNVGKNLTRKRSIDAYCKHLNIEDKQYTSDKRKSSRFPTSSTSERINCLFCNTFVDFISSPSDGIQVKNY